LKITEAELADLIAKGHRIVGVKGRLSSLVPDPEPEIVVKRKAAHTWGKMNRTEARYAAHLAATRPHAKVYFERVTLKLGHDCRYTPDFLVEEPTTCGCGEDGAAFHEVKGPHRRDDAMVKLRVAASAFPIFTFYLCEEADGVWRAKLVPPE